MDVQQLIVEAGGTKSPLYIGLNASQTLAKFCADRNYSSLAIVADSDLPELLVARIQDLLKLPLRSIIRIKASETTKSILGLEEIWGAFQRFSLDRKSLVINIGGGVVCDLGGFAASTYMRGIDFVHVPTTLLAQVDASIGGKVGVNFGGVKNLIGSFQQPAAVFIDTAFLASLPSSQLRSGFAEVVKHGLIRDKDYFHHVTGRPFTDWEDLSEIIFRSCQIKKQVIEQDPTESGLRAILNFGHTVGHALESLSQARNTPLLHGEAVILGMIAEAKLSPELSQEELSQIEAGFMRAELKITISEPYSWRELLGLMQKDKKNSAGQIHWTPLKALGDASFKQTLDMSRVEEVLRELSYVV
jgi:3-dehydroquinate synthase